MYETTGGQFSPDENRIEAWRTVEDGGLLAVGIQGPLTGFGINGLAILDDPLKDRADAESQQIRDSIWDWILSVYATRLEKGSTPFVVATRWHQDDPSGRLLRGEMAEFPEWRHIHLRAIETDDAGEEHALWPSMFSLEKLRAKRGPYGGGKEWWSLYQGEPRPADGALFGPATYEDCPLDIGKVYGGLRVA
jgi:hypothetical protein